MKREDVKHLTVRGAVKDKFPSVFRALHADALRYPGGISGLANQLGQNPSVFSNKFNPNCHDSTPTLENVLEVIEHCGAHRGVTSIALLAGLCVVDLPKVAESPSDAVLSFLEVVSQCGMLMARSAKDLQDGRLDADEREACAQLLDTLIPAAVQLRALVRS